jgi:hypothetical protein
MAMAYSQTIDQAAKELDSTLRGFPWYVSTGIGASDFGQTIFVYVTSARSPGVSRIQKHWMGFPVKITPVGKVRAIGW